MRVRIGDWFEIRGVFGESSGCGHRKYGEVYRSYSALNSGLEVRVFKRWFRVKCFGLVSRCFVCDHIVFHCPGFSPKEQLKFVHPKFYTALDQERIWSYGRVDKVPQKTS